VCCPPRHGCRLGRLFSHKRRCCEPACCPAPAPCCATLPQPCCGTAPYAYGMAFDGPHWF
ncbi:MAG TPA: hypothetical protein EYG03_28575, partial [Planctomycetes bacterium]|nr:hypothetical protein [Planctomycetota bacterium]